MSDKHEQEEGDLIDTESTESAADDAEDTQDEGEQKQESLDLEDESDSEESKKEVAKGEEQKLKKIQSYQRKIDSGEITLDTLPENEKWLKDYLKPKVELDKDAVKQVLQEERETEMFNTLKEKLETADLPDEKIKKLNEKYKQFRTKGLTRLDALEAAKEIADIDLDEVQNNPKRKAMRLPKPGTKATTQDYEQMYKDLPFAEAQKLIPEKVLDEILKNNARG